MRHRILATRMGSCFRQRTIPHFTISRRRARTLWCRTMARLWCASIWRGRATFFVGDSSSKSWARRCALSALRSCSKTRPGRVPKTPDQEWQGEPRRRPFSPFVKFLGPELPETGGAPHRVVHNVQATEGRRGRQVRDAHRDTWEGVPLHPRHAAHASLALLEETSTQ